MGTALRIIGALWAGIGIVNLIMMFGGSAPPALWERGLITNSVAFLIPGLVVLAIGVMLYKKNETKTTHQNDRSAQ